MGFNKLNLPEINDLQSIREKMQDDVIFLKRYWFKPDAIFGSQESMNYMKEIVKIYEEQKSRESGNPR